MRCRASKHLRVLTIDDSERDAELLRNHLERAGQEVVMHRVETHAAMKAALQAPEWDIVLVDSSIPRFGALNALSVLKEAGLDIPLIVITGANGEELGVKAMLAGAHDCVNRDRPARLAAAVDREVEQARNRQALRALEAEFNALRESEECYRLLFEGGPDPSYIVDFETLRIVVVNEAMIRRYGYSRDELLSMTVEDIWPPQEAPAQLERWAKWQSGITYERTWRHQEKNGSVIEVEITVRPLLFAGRPTHVVQAHDVTAERSLEARLRQSQRMEAIGQLAGGIAHDFNNMLTIINGYSDFTLDQLAADDPLRKNIEEIQKAGFRAASLTRQLLAFSRKQALQPMQLKLNSVITELEKMLGRLIGEDVELRTVLDPSLGSVKADPAQIEQVIMNLAINARDAMPKGGKLTIRTANADLDDQYAKEHVGVVPGSFVSLAVSDTGVGMDPQTLALLSEPSVATKQPGKVVGLGLATVCGIVSQSGGHFRINSEPGVGTTFEIYFPRTDEPAGPYKHTAKSADAFQGTETILLAEDEDTVRILAHRVLEKYGYRVLEAANGDAAIDIVQRYPERIHLLVTDVIMPEMNGCELFARLSAFREGLKVLYMSGYTENSLAQTRTLESTAPFVQKPFVPETLASAVREVLDSLSSPPPPVFL